jgi:glycosyltransferase involved in cell wall biosynthesis
VRIGIESSIITRSKAGIGFYTYQLVRALAALDGDEEYSLLYNRPLPPMPLPSRLRHVYHGPKSTHLWVQTRLSGICRREGIDILHSPGLGIPLLYSGKRILTVHDLSPMLYPEQKELGSRMVWNGMVPIMAKNADHIITPSDHTRKDVIEILGIEKEKVTRIYEAAGEEYYPEPDSERMAEFRRNKALDGGYILAVATLEPRKNIPFLLTAFKHWLDRSKSNATLVIVGKKGWLYNEIFETYEKLKLHKYVRFEGYVEDIDLLRIYYSAAQFFMLAPIYEGFWLPGLESLACGTPVIAPRTSSIPEVIGDAGFLLDSWDLDEWSDAMDRLWFASDREAWSRRGVERSRMFSWDQAARETLAVYRKVGEMQH